jgi:hypothetical protein
LLEAAVIVVAVDSLEVLDSAVEMLAAALKMVVDMLVVVVPAAPVDVVVVAADDVAAVVAAVVVAKIEGVVDAVRTFPVLYPSEGH